MGKKWPNFAKKMRYWPDFPYLGYFSAILSPFPTSNYFSNGQPRQRECRLNFRKMSKKCPKTVPKLSGGTGNTIFRHFFDVFFLFGRCFGDPVQCSPITRLFSTLFSFFPIFGVRPTFHCAPAPHDCRPNPGKHPVPQGPCHIQKTTVILIQYGGGKKIRR